MWFLISFCLAGSNCFHPSSDIKRSETSLRPFFAALETKSKHISAGFLESVFASLHLKVNLCVSLELQSGSVSGGVSVVELANMWSLLWLLPDFVYVAVLVLSAHPKVCSSTDLQNLLEYLWRSPSTHFLCSFCSSPRPVDGIGWESCDSWWASSLPVASLTCVGSALLD